MTPRLEKASKIIQWAKENNKSLRRACEFFRVNERYLRKIRGECVGYEGYEEFIKLYNSFKNSANINEPESDLKDGQKKFTESDNNASFEYKGDEMIKSLEEAISFFKIDTRIWEVDKWICNSYPVSGKEREQDLTWKGGVMSGYAKRSGSWTSKVNYQVKVWLKKKVQFEVAIKFEDFFVDLLKKHKPINYPKIKYSKNNTNNLLEVSIYDLHLGKLVYGQESNNNYDTKIATKRFKHAIVDLLKKAESSSYERILFIVGNDFFNSDNHLGETTKGTKQDEDNRWQKTFRTGTQLLIYGIDYMRTFAPVDILVIPGNHDYTKSFFLGETLAAWYRNDKSVNVNNSANPRKYYEYGKVLLGFSHGNNEKREKLRSLMAWEMKEAWARTAYREFHLGHQHRELATEELGITIRSLSSLSGSDLYHHLNGFIGPTRAAEAFLWNKERGLEARFTSNIIAGDDLD